MVPCEYCECENWDSDQYGGHCMLALPHIKLNHYTGKRYCDDYHLEVKQPTKQRKQSKRKKKTPE